MDGQTHRQALPLSRFELFRSADVDCARERVASKFCDHRLTRSRSHGRFDTRHHHVRGDTLSLNYIQYGDEVEIDPGDLGSFYLVQVPLEGNATVRNGNDEVMASNRCASLLNPHRSTRMTWHEGCRKLLLQIDRDAIERIAEANLGHALPGPITFRSDLDLQQPRQRAWWMQFQAVVQAADRGELFEGAAPMSQCLVEEELLAGLLRSQPSSISHFLWRGLPSAGSRTLKRAVDFMHASLDRAVTIGEVAEAAGVSPRSLQLAFRERYGVSPLRYLRDRRLDHAHFDLTHGDGAEAVTSVAMKWGFTHMSRFSAAYRERFGRCPSDRAGASLPFGPGAPH